ncbi:tigger transposable element-derived protein 4 [Elysia marginata]|uniref:Tigger transposable element-derived protein 4 n=1 Tax=Elysia marginata TaxID=1093978 RepID=A0AAV4G844_9GAST|nr:tigger transposable element-derived protein 4 [Elysia marginata]
MSETEKLPLFTIRISKYNKSRCLKKIITLPTEYKVNAKAWMTRTIFEDWVSKLDRKYLLKFHIIALAIDKYPAHLAIEGLKVTTFVFLPPNITGILRSCDQGTIQALEKCSTANAF